MKKLLFFLPILWLNVWLIGQRPERVNGTQPVMAPTFLPSVVAPLSQEPAIKDISLPNGVTLAYAEQGDEAGTPVILLHGYSDSWRSWQTVLPHLPSSLRVFALSQRGHGNSSKPVGSYHPADFAGDVASFMKKKGLKEAVIVGHSMGSTVAQCFAVTYPALAKALVLNSSFATYDKPMVAGLKELVDALNDPVDSAFVAGFQKSTFRLPLPGMPFDTVVAESRKLPAHVWKGVAAGWKVSDFRKALPAYTKPALIVWGNKDSYCPRSDQATLHKALKNARLEIYEGIGHALHWEAPERFAKDLVQFIQSLQPPNSLAKTKRDRSPDYNKN